MEPKRDECRASGPTAPLRFVSHHLIIVLLPATLQHYLQDGYDVFFFFPITSAGCVSLPSKIRKINHEAILLVPDTRAMTAGNTALSETAWHSGGALHTSVEVFSSFGSNRNKHPPEFDERKHQNVQNFCKLILG